MSKVQKVDEAGTTVVLSDDQFKEALHETIAGMVRKHTDRVLSKPHAKRIFDRLTELIFQRVIETGYFRFPGGYGSLKLTKLRENAVVRTMPDGTKVKPRMDRYKIRYKDGVAVMEKLGTSPHKYRRKNPRKSVSEGHDSATV